MSHVVGLLVALIASASATVATATATLTVRYAKTSWSEKDGLPSPIVWSLAQDAEGYLWIGTARGLVRFDGIRFEPFDNPQLPASNVGVPALSTTLDGSIWRAFWGLARVDRIVGERTESYGPADGLPNGEIRVLLTDREDTVWAGGRGGMSRFRNGRWERVELPSGLTVWTLHQDRQSDIWAGTSAGIYRYSIGSEAFTLVERLSQIAVGFAEGRDGNVLVMDPRRGFKRLAGSAPLRQWTFPELGEASRLFGDRRGNLWVGTQGRGLLRRSDVGRHVERHTVDNGLAGNVVLSLMEDREGNLWVGTADGLTRFSEGTFAAVPVFDGASGLVRAVAAGKDNTIWVGTRRGLIRFANGTARTFGYRDGLPRLVVSAIHAEESGAVWIGTAGGLVRYSAGRIRTLPFAAGLNVISAITTDLSGGVWICDRDRGILRWYRNRLIGYNHVPELTGKPVSAAFTDRRNRVWIGFGTGTLAVFAGDGFRVYTQADGLAGGPVTSIFEDDQHVWIGTTDGLSRFSDGRFTTLTVRNSLPTDRLSSAIEDDSGFIWMGGNDRVLRLHRDDFDRATATHAAVDVRTYDASDGLRGDPLFGQGYPAVARDTTGSLWFVTTVGISQADPRRLFENKVPPVVKIEEMIVNGSRVVPSDDIRLSSRVATLRFNYSALSLRGPSKVRFRFKMDGIDSNWIDNGTSRVASYTNMAPGRYSFRVAASREGGTWSESGPVVQLVVPAQFYETAWFYVLCITMAAGASAMSWRWRIAQVRQRYAFVLAERARMGRELHDTLLQSLVGLGLHLDNIADQLGSSFPPRELEEELRRIRKHVDRHIVEARQSIWDLRRPESDTKDFAETVREESQTIASGRGIPVEFAVHGTPRRCSAAVQRQLLHIAREAVTNAVRHANATRISVLITYDNAAVGIRVADDGRGFSANGEEYERDGHWGMAIMHERALQVGGRFSIVSTPGSGTIIEASVPLAAPSSAELLA